MNHRAILTTVLLIHCLGLIGAVDGPVIRDVTWEQGPPMRYMLKYQAQGLVGGRILCAVGTQVPGCGPDQVSDRAWLFDPTTGKYEDLPSAPTPMGRAEGVAVGDDLYLIAAILCPDNVAKGSPQFSRKFWRISRRSGAWRWEELAPLPYVRVTPTVTKLDSIILVIGGHGLFDPEDPTNRLYKSRDSVPLSSVHAFDTNRPENGWFELPPVPGMGRQSVAAGVLGRKLYVFGGAYYKTWLSGSHLVFNGDAYVFDIDKVSWRKLPDVPVPAWGMAAVPHGDRSIILFGGDTSGIVEHPYQYAEKWKGVTRPNSEVFVFDTQLETYRVLPTPLPLIEMTEEYRRELDLRRQKGAKDNLKVNNYDHSRGIRRNNAKVSVIGDRLYVLGGVTGVGERTAHAVGELHRNHSALGFGTYEDLRIG